MKLPISCTQVFLRHWKICLHEIAIKQFKTTTIIIKQIEKKLYNTVVGFSLTPVEK